MGLSCGWVSRQGLAKELSWFQKTRLRDSLATQPAAPVLGGCSGCHWWGGCNTGGRGQPCHQIQVTVCAESEPLVRDARRNEHNEEMRSSRRGSAQTDPLGPVRTRALIPGLAQWVRGPAGLGAVVWVADTARSWHRCGRGGGRGRGSAPMGPLAWELRVPQAQFRIQRSSTVHVSLLHPAHLQGGLTVFSVFLPRSRPNKFQQQKTQDNK